MVFHFPCYIIQYILHALKRRVCEVQVVVLPPFATPLYAIYFTACVVHTISLNDSLFSISDRICGSFWSCSYNSKLCVCIFKACPGQSSWPWPSQLRGFWASVILSFFPHIPGRGNSFTAFRWFFVRWGGGISYPLNFKFFFHFNIIFLLSSFFSFFPNIPGRDNSFTAFRGFLAGGWR